MYASYHNRLVDPHLDLRQHRTIRPRKTLHRTHLAAPACPSGAHNMDVAIMRSLAQKDAK